MWLFCFLCCFLVTVVHAENWSLQARAGYFFPAAKLLREVYHNGGFEPEIEGSVKVRDQLRFWTNFNAFIRSGHSQGLHNSTSIRIYPLSAGFKYNFKMRSSWDFYLGLGPSLTWVSIHDHSPYVKQHIHKTGWGVVGKSGFIYRFYGHGFVDLFADYYYTQIGSISRRGVQSHSLNVGGLRVGLGIGRTF
jgi:outer membrane protein